MHFFRDPEFFGNLGVKHPTLRPTTVRERRAQGALPSPGAEPIKTTAASPLVAAETTLQPQSAGPIRTPIKLGIRLVASLKHKNSFMMRRDPNYRHTPTKERQVGINQRMLRRLSERQR